MKGRKPTPTVLKMVRGNPGKRPINTSEPKPDALVPTCPPELTDAVAQVEWERTIRPAVERKQITSAERALAIAHCELWATWQSQLADAARHPHVVSGGKNHPIPNPARGMANKTLMLLKAVDSELGLTPTSRARLSVPTAEQNDPLAEFLREG